MSNKQVIVQPSIEDVEIIETPIPVPRDKEVVIKVAVAASGPKDWKYPLWQNYAHNSGDDMAGIVHAVGKDVYEFKPGDRVAAIHAFLDENGSYAEYATAPDWTTLHIPEHVPFEEAATVTSSAMTAAVALFVDMKLPAPWEPKTPTENGKKVPLVIYGVTTAVGAFAAKLARLAGLQPIIGIAGRAAEFASTVSDYVVDYRKGIDALVAGIEEILAQEGLARKAPYVFDAISEGGTLEATLRFLDHNGGTVSTVLPPKLFAEDKENFHYPAGVKAINTGVPRIQDTDKDIGYLWSRYFGRLLVEGRLTGHPYEVVPGGLHGVLKGLQKLKAGEASAVKYVYRIDGNHEAPKVRNETGNEDSKQPAAAKLSQPQSIESSQHPLSSFPFPAKGASHQ